jgi:hypothetical protein
VVGRHPCSRQQPEVGPVVVQQQEQEVQQGSAGAAQAANQGCRVTRWSPE